VSGRDAAVQRVDRQCAQASRRYCKELERELQACTRDIAALEARCAAAPPQQPPRHVHPGQLQLVLYNKGGTGKGKAASGAGKSLAELRAEMEALRWRQEPFLLKSGD
jgi:hypothetical protein